MKRQTKIRLSVLLLCIAIVLILLGVALLFAAGAPGNSLFLVIPGYACYALGLVLAYFAIEIRPSW